MIQVVTNAREWKKIAKQLCFWKNKLNFWPNFSKIWPKKVQNNQTFEKVTFDAKNVLLGWKLLLADIFWPKNQRKKRFFENSAILWFFQHKKKSGLAEVLVLEDSPHIKQKDMMMVPIEISFRAANGSARYALMIWQSEPILFFPIFSLRGKHIRFFVLEQTVTAIWQTRGTSVSGKHLIKFDRLPRGETPDSPRWLLAFRLYVEFTMSLL